MTHVASSKHAIIGMAFNYNDLKIRPFLKSLEESGFDGDLILFINNRSSITFILNYSYQIKLINTDELTGSLQTLQRYSGYLFNKRYFRPDVLKRIKEKQPFTTWQLSFFMTRFSFNVARFALYYHYIVTGEYEKIFLTDVNDVIFQGDVFKETANDTVYVFEEHTGTTIAEDENNRSWITAAFGETVFNEISAGSIHCAGTILGGHAIMLQFLTDFITYIMQENVPDRLYGYDQALLNYMVLYKKEKYFKVHENGTKVFTVALQPLHDIVIGEKYISLRAVTPVPVVIHQYNRYKSLVHAVQARYL